MPELPEVETIKRDLEDVLINKKIKDVVFMWPGILKGVEPEIFLKYVKNIEILSVQRRAKNISIKLSNDWNLLFHMKMTGHLIYTDKSWKVDKNGKWIAHNKKNSPLFDPLNQFIRVIFYLSNNKILAFSDLRKFAYVKLLNSEELTDAFKNYGPEPFSNSFNLEYLTKLFSKKNVSIKKVILDQKNIAGIGNIYADEILWESKIHPLRAASSLTKNEIKLFYKSTKSILTRAIEKRGTSTSDFRDISGKKGSFSESLRVYRQTDKPCERDGNLIQRISVGGRGTHFCSKCQKLEAIND